MTVEDSSVVGGGSQGPSSEPELAPMNSSAKEALSGVSVVIPYFNSSDSINRVVNALRAQTLQPRELIVVDDRSTALERIALERVLTKVPFETQIVSLQTNSGPGVARNVGWDRARGNFVAFCDADDVWWPRKLEIQAAWMQRHHDVVATCHATTEVGASVRASKKVKEIASIDLTLRSMVIRNRVATSSVMVRREVPQRFHKTRRYCEDYYLWLSIVSSGARFACLSAVMSTYGKRENGGLRLSSRLVRMELAELANFFQLMCQGSLSWRLTFFGAAFSLIKFARRALRVRVILPLVRAITPRKIDRGSDCV